MSSVRIRPPISPPTTADEAPMTVRLEWDGKPERVERLHLPFQTVETINESRATRERDTGALFGAPTQRRPSATC